MTLELLLVICICGLGISSSSYMTVEIGVNGVKAGAVEPLKRSGLEQDTRVGGGLGEERTANIHDSLVLSTTALEASLATR